MRRRRPHIDRNKTNRTTLAGMNRLISLSQEPVTERDVADKEIAVLAAIDCIVRGHGTTDNYSEIAHAINAAWILCTERGVGEELKPYLLVAQDGMKRMAKRYYETGKIGFDGLALEAVRRVVELWHDQLLLCSVGEVFAADQVAEEHFWKMREVA